MRWRALAALVLILLVCAALGVYRKLRFEHEAEQPIHLAESVAEAAPEIRSSVGQPETFQHFPDGSLAGDDQNGTAHLEIEIGGPLGFGKLLVTAQAKNGKWQICSMLFRTKTPPNETTVVSDASTHCAKE